MSHSEWHKAARTQRLLFTTEVIAVRGISVPDAQPAKHNLLLPVPPQARLPRLEGRLQFPELVVLLRIPLPLPLGVQKQIDCGTEVPGWER